MSLTPADVRGKHFSTTRLRPGYDEEEVDAFLDEVEAELDRLIQENEELRARLAEVSRGGGAPGIPVPAPPVPGQGFGGPLPAPPMPVRQEQRPGPAGMGAGQGDDAHSAARVLSLAQQIADQAIADARREADETLRHARREADDVLARARRQAEQVTGEARERAEGLDQDAQERHRQALGSLVQEREELERRVDDLRALEHGYRGRLRAFLEGRLRDLDAGAVGGDEVPAIPAFPEPGLSGAHMRMSGNRQP